MRSLWHAAACLLLLGLVGQVDAASAARKNAPATLDDDASNALTSWDEALRTFRTDVWIACGLEPALGKDARGRTVSDDVADWVLPRDVRRQLESAHDDAREHFLAGKRAAGEAELDGARGLLQRQQQSLEIIGHYWQRQFALSRQRSLWQQWLVQVPDSDQRASEERVAPLLQSLQAGYTSTATPQLVIERMQLLLHQYDSERARLAALATDGKPPILSRDRDIPCIDSAPDQSPAAKAPGGVQPIQLLRRAAVADFYPASARREQVSGRVMLRVTVDASGCERRADVLRSSGVPSLDDAAIDVAEFTSYVPGTRDGKPVESMAALPVVFMLDAKAASATAKPDHPPAIEHLNRGNDLLNEGEPAGAIVELNQAIQLNPNLANAYGDRGLAYIGQSNYAAARSDFDAAERIDANNVLAARGRGVLALTDGDCQTADAKFSQALEVEPKNEFELRRRASARLCLKRYEDALTDFDRVLEFAPTRFELYVERSLIQRALHQTDQAAEQARTVVAAHPGEPDAYLAAGEILTEMGRGDEARSALDRAVELSPSERSYFARERLREPADRSGRRADLEAALKLNPGAGGAVLELTRLDVEEGRNQPDLPLPEKSASVTTVYEWQLRRGIFDWKAGNTARARQEFEAAGEGAETGELNNICWYLATLDIDLPAALKACDAGLERAPHAAAVLDSRAFVLLRLKRFQEAQAQFEQALAQSPLEADSLYGRGMALRRLGARAESDASFRDALALDATVARRYQQYGITP